MSCLAKVCGVQLFLFLQFCPISLCFLSQALNVAFFAFGAFVGIVCHLASCYLLAFLVDIAVAIKAVFTAFLTHNNKYAILCQTLMIALIATKADDECVAVGLNEVLRTRVSWYCRGS